MDRVIRPVQSSEFQLVVALEREKPRLWTFFRPLIRNGHSNLTAPTQSSYSLARSFRCEDKSHNRY